MERRFDRLPIPLRALAALASLVLVAPLPACAHGPAQHFSGMALPAKPAPDFTLTDQDGRSFRLSDQHGRVVVLFFGYTHCPDVCPATMAQLAKVYRGLSPAQRARVRVAFVTVDPQRDDPRALKRYVDLFDGAFIGLTGSESALDPVYAAYHVFHQRLPGKGSAYLVTHGSSVYLIGPNGDLRVLHDWDDPEPSFAADVKELLG